MTLFCGTCVHFSKHKETGVLKTNKACSDWKCNAKSLSINLRKVRVLITKLTEEQLNMFVDYWNNETIIVPLSRVMYCKDCKMFPCSHGASEEDRPHQYRCKDWCLDLYASRHSEKCPIYLRKLLILTKKLSEQERIYTTYFLNRHVGIKRMRKFNIALGDYVKYQINDIEAIYGRVVDMNEEHIFITDGKIKLQVLFGSVVVCDKKV